MKAGQRHTTLTVHLSWPTVMAVKFLPLWMEIRNSCPNLNPTSLQHTQAGKDTFSLPFADFLILCIDFTPKVRCPAPVGHLQTFVPERSNSEKPGTQNLIFRTFWEEKREIQAKHLNFSIMEVPPRFELGSEGFADLCLTTWPRHRIWK